MSNAATPNAAVGTRALVNAAVGTLGALAQWWASVNDTPNPAPISNPALVRVTKNEPIAAVDAVAALLPHHDVLVLSTDHGPQDIAPPVVCGALTVTDAASVTDTHYDRDGKLDHAAWMATCCAIRDRLPKLPPPGSTLADAVTTDTVTGLADNSLKTCVDLIVAATQAKLPVLLDGPGPAAAALVACHDSPDIAPWCRPLQQGASPTEARAWEFLGIEPVLPVSSAMHDGRLAAAAIELINASLTPANRP